MRIVVNHLTRMEPGYMCVAGVDVETRQHIRPVVARKISTDFLCCHRGPFDIGSIVDLGPVTADRYPPQVEDHKFDPRKAAFLRFARPDRFYGLLQDLSQWCVSEIFGSALTYQGTSCVVEVGQGKASLGCLSLKISPEIYIRQRPDKRSQVRMRVDDGDLTLDLGVTDIRLYHDDHLTPDDVMVAHVAHKIQDKIDFALCVGLTKPYAPSPQQRHVHWLQVNNIHFADDPIWQVRRPNR